MFELPLHALAPHYCCSCEQIGAILCDRCRYDISEELFEGCLLCGKPAARGRALCRQHNLPYSSAWCVGERAEALKTVIDRYKFERARESYKVLASLLHFVLPILPTDVVVVPVPTIRRHIRLRGYDHTALVAREFARLRRLPYATHIQRATTTSQFGKSRRIRQDQARHAFRCDSVLAKVYLLVDDIFTTGATIEYAAKALRDAGAADVWVAVLARQPLEK